MSQPVHRAAEILDRVYAALKELQIALADLEPLVGSRAAAPDTEEAYLSIRELVARIQYEEQTVRNLMSQGDLREGYHYLQRMKHGRIVFVWSRMQEWMRERSEPGRRETRNDIEPFYRGKHARTHKAG